MHGTAPSYLADDLRRVLDVFGFYDTLIIFCHNNNNNNNNLHLHCVKDMLNLFACTGHNVYAKGYRLYLQVMMDLPNSHPWLYSMFAEHGLHAVRRSPTYWGGLSTDLLIEQTLMKVVKGFSFQFPIGVGSLCRPKA